MLRRVRYYKYTKDINYRTNKELLGEATFLQFGCEYEQFEEGPGNYTTAIIELDNGKVMVVLPNEIEFIKED